jgi:hypothetical protein
LITDGKGGKIQQNWNSSGKKTTPWDSTLWFDGDATDIIVTGTNDTGLIWDEHRTQSVRYPVLAENKTVTFAGTTLNMTVNS